jgi:predicted S18 family serine protease
MLYRAIRPAALAIFAFLILSILSASSYADDPVPMLISAQDVLSTQPISAPYCNGSISLPVPAVVGKDGGLVDVTLDLVPSMSGHGNIYAGVYPTLGVSTQESIDKAVTYAFAASGKELSCDALVSFDSSQGTTDYIEGPSAGAAFTIMTYALLNNRTLRNDTIVTGTIEDNGDIGAVGGLYEKADSAARGGASYFLTPVEGFYEMLILRNVERRDGIKVLQARTVEDVLGFMLDDIPIDQEKMMPAKRTAPDVSSYDSRAIGSFLPVASRMVSLENQSLAAITGTDKDSSAVREFYTSETERQSKLLDKGYLFTAANEAFLDYIDLSTIHAILANDADLARKKGELGICLTSIKRPALTEKNFEWVVGSDLRQAWAYDKLNSDTNESGLLEEERYLRINDLSYGVAWCNVAKSLLSSAPQGGDSIDENAWKELASQELADAEGKSLQKADSLSRLGIAKKSFDDGRYGAAIFDAAYAMNNEEDPPADANATKAQVQAYLAKDMSSLWGRIYISHAAFLYSQNQSDPAWSAARFASELDDATARMVKANSPPAQGKIMTPIDSSNSAAKDDMQTAYLLFAAGFAALSIFLLVVALIVLTSRKRRTDGNNSERAGRAYRTEQKKG